MAVILLFHMDATISDHYIDANGMHLYYLAAGRGAPVLMLHGWPTSLFLWRNILTLVARKNCAIALDLPGFGRSDKPLNRAYNFRFFEKTIKGFLDALGIARVGLAVHDLGGPVGLYWACAHPDRVSSLAILNTFSTGRQPG